jgi:vacuolar-type H+-ATPase subunit D/Vma8
MNIIDKKEFEKRIKTNDELNRLKQHVENVSELVDLISKMAAVANALKKMSLQTKNVSSKINALSNL